jgi:phage N-6-adenine-methyltransferase
MSTDPDAGGEVPGAGRCLYRANHAAGNNEWYTPERYVAAARRVLGTIDLDPASCEYAQRRVKALQYYTAADDGLAQPWHGAVWLNPPFSPHALLSRFVTKLADEIRAERVTAAILLTPNYTDTKWFNIACKALPTHCFARGRVRFDSAHGISQPAASGQVFHYFGPRVALFRKVFAKFGWLNLRADTNGEVHAVLRRFENRVTENRICAYCSNLLDGQIMGARYCTNACRQAAYRERRAAESRTP